MFASPRVFFSGTSNILRKMGTKTSFGYVCWIALYYIASLSNPEGDCTMLIEYQEL